MVAAAGDVDVVVDLATKDEARLTTKDAPLRGSVSRPGANHVHDRDTIFFFLSASRVGVVPAYLSFSFFFPSLLCERGPRKGRISSSRDLSLI